MKRRRSLLRTVSMVLGVLAMLLAGAIALLTATGPGLKLLANSVSRLATGENGGVRVAGLSDIWSGTMQIGQLTLSDSRGPYATVDGLEIDWTRSALAALTFSAQRITAGRIEILRRPVPGPDDGEPLRLPLKLDLKAIDLPDIRLGEELAGEEVALTANGRLAARADMPGLAGALEARPASRDGRLAADFSFDVDTGALRLDAAIEEPAGGILAAELDLPGKPALSLGAQADGTLAKARFSIRGTADGQSAISLEGTGGLAGGRFVLAATGSGIPSLIAPEPFRDLLAGQFDLDIDLEGETAGRLTVNAARIDAENFYAVLRGRLDVDGDNDLTGGLTARNGALDLPGGLIGGLGNVAPTSIAFAVSGPAQSASVMLSADFAGIDAGGIQARGLRAIANSQAMQLATRKGAFDLRFEIDAVTTRNETLQRLFPARTFGEGSGSIDGGLLTLDRFTVANPAFEGSTSLTADLMSRNARGSTSLGVRADALPPALSARSNDRLEASAEFEVQPGAIVVPGLKVAHGGDLASGKFAISDGKIEAVLEAGIASLGGFADGLEGGMQIAAELSGPITAPRAGLVATAPRINAHGHAITDLRAEVTGLASVTDPDLVFSLSGAIDSLPLTGNARFLTRPGGRVVEGIELLNGDNRITGGLMLDETNAADGTLDVSLPDIAPLAALAGQDMQGAINGTIRFEPGGSDPAILVDLSSNRLARAEITVEAAAVDLVIRDYLATPALQGRASAAGIQRGGTRIDGPKAEFALDGDWTRFAIAAAANGAPVSARGRVRSAKGETTVELAEADAGFRGVTATLAAPTIVTVRDGAASLADARVLVGGGTATVNGRLGEALDATVDLAGIDAATANRFSPGLGAQGSLSGRITVSGRAADPAARFAVDLADASISATRTEGVPSLAIRSEGSYRASVVDVSLNASGGGGLDASGSGRIGLGSAQRLDFRLRGALPYSLLAARLAGQGLALQGMANADLVLSGTPSQPVVNGTLSSANGRFIHAPSGIAIEDLGLAARFGGQQAVIERLTGRLSTGGTLNITGSVALSGGFPADMTITLREGRYTDRGTVDARFDADLALTGPLTGDPVLGGRIAMQKAVITVPDRLPESISRLDVRHVNASEAVMDQAEAIRPTEGSGSARGGLRMNLALSAPNQVYMRGRGIDAELGGEMRLFGPVASPNADGGFSMRRGRLSILGKRLDFSRGIITFFPGSLVPALDMLAETTADGTTVSVAVTGPATAPQFAFASVPPLPEDEVLAKLMFNSSMSNLSPLQIAQLAQAAATLAGKGGSTSLLDRLQRALPVDDIDVRTNAETGETTVGAGSYVNDRTYVGVERGQAAGTGKVRVDLSIGRGVKVRGEADEAGRNKAGIFYEREY